MIDLKNLTDEERQHIVESIEQKYSEGELTGEGWKGWWRLSFEKWENK